MPRHGPVEPETYIYIYILLQKVKRGFPVPWFLEDAFGVTILHPNRFPCFVVPGSWKFALKMLSRAQKLYNFEHFKHFKENAFDEIVKNAFWKAFLTILPFQITLDYT